MYHCSNDVVTLVINCVFQWPVQAEEEKDIGRPTLLLLGLEGVCCQSFTYVLSEPALRAVEMVHYVWCQGGVLIASFCCRVVFEWSLCCLVLVAAKQLSGKWTLFGIASQPGLHRGGWVSAQWCVRSRTSCLLFLRKGPSKEGYFPAQGDIATGKRQCGMRGAVCRRAHSCLLYTNLGGS